MKCLASTGKITITLLCIQMLVINISGRVMRHITENARVVGWTSIMTTLLCGWLLAYVLNKIRCKNLKWVKYL